MRRRKIQNSRWKNSIVAAKRAAVWKSPLVYFILQVWAHVWAVWPRGTHRAGQSVCVYFPVEPMTRSAVFTLSRVDSQYRPGRKVFPPGLLTHTQLRHPSDVTQPPQQLPHREENENEIKDDVWGHAVIWEEWTEQCRACVHVRPGLPDDYLERLRSYSDIRASQWRQMTTTVTRENTFLPRKLKVIKYAWLCVLPAAKWAQVYKDLVTS